MPPRLLPNINWVRAAICPAVVFIAMSMDRGYQTDFWHHLARGREIAHAGSPAGSGVETFTFTVAGQPVRDANWLTQLTYFRLYETGGLPLVQTANALVLAAGAGLLVWVCRRRGAPPAVAAGVAVFAFAGAWQTLLIRPQSVSLLLFALMLAILFEAERRRGLLLLPPILMALWANLHGGFPIGLVLIAAFLLATLAERWSAPLRRRLLVTVARDDLEGGLFIPDPGGDARATELGAALSVRAGRGMAPALTMCLVASTAATLLNPYGLGVYEYVYSLSTLAAGRNIEEWLPPSMGLWVGRAFVVSVAGLIVLLALARRRPRARDVFVALCFLPLACSSVRMVPWWLLAVAPVLAATIGRNFAAGTEPGRPAPRPTVAALAMLALIGATTLLSLPWLERINPVFGRLRPATRPEADIHAVLERVRALGDARVFTRLEWGEYLAWAGHPNARVFMDGRVEIYPDDVWGQYHAVTWARDDWQAILDGRGVDHLLLDASFHADLLPRVEASGGWRRVGAAGPAVLFARTGATGPVLTDLRDAR